MDFISHENLIRKLLENKGFRDSYVESFVRNGIAFQLRSMRDVRGLTQGDLAQLAGKTQSAISRLENPDNGTPNITSLLEIASALEVALLVKFVPFSRLLREYEDTTQSALDARSIRDDLLRLTTLGGTIESKGTVSPRLKLISAASVPITPTQISLPLNAPRLVIRGGNYVAPTNNIKSNIGATRIISQDSTYRAAGGR